MLDTLAGTGRKEKLISPGKAREEGSEWSRRGIPGRKGTRCGIHVAAAAADSHDEDGALPSFPFPVFG